jgi:Fe-Mn family superoxide dismutase
MAFELRPLPYARDALAPHMSKETLDYHYGKHHKGYVDKLNALIKDSDFKNENLETIITAAKDTRGAAALFNNAAQVWNHDFFWRSMDPDGGGEPGGVLANRIVASFGDFETFQKAFAEAATGQFGSGWAWLVQEKDGKLAVVSTPNAVPPFVNGLKPLLTCDVWEHAYYIDYRNDRGAFVHKFLDRLVNWAFATERMESR